MSANDIAVRVAATMLSREGTGPAWGIKIEEAREGYARISMRLRAGMLNGHGTAHGGMIFALADTAFAYAQQPKREDRCRAGFDQLPRCRARGRAPYRRGAGAGACGPLGRLQCEREGEDGRFIAIFQGLSRTIGGPIIGDET